MKFILIFLSIVTFISCQSPNKQGADIELVSNEISKDETSINIEEFKEYFQSVTLTSDTFHIHHYRWATDSKDFEGLLIAPKIFKEYVDVHQLCSARVTYEGNITSKRKKPAISRRRSELQSHPTFLALLSRPCQDLSLITS